jgi:hypothetical protein
MRRRIGRAAELQARREAMSIQMNRILDVVVSFAVVGLALTIAGATAVLGA